MSDCVSHIHLVNVHIDPENNVFFHQCWVETNLPSPIWQGRTVHLLEGMAMLSSPQVRPGHQRCRKDFTVRFAAWNPEAVGRKKPLESKLINGSSWIPMDFTGFLSMNTNEYQWISMNINEYQWIMMRLITSAYKMASYHGVDVVFVHTAQAIGCRWWWSAGSMSSTQQWIPGSKLIRIKKTRLESNTLPPIGNKPCFM